MSLLDLEKHFAFYGSYHSNPINIVIHVFLVWPILFTALLFLYFTPPIFSPSQTLLNYIPSVLIFNFGFFYAVFYALFYVALDVKAGSFVALLTLLCWAGSSFVANSIGFELAWKVLLFVHLKLIWPFNRKYHVLFFENYYDVSGCVGCSVVLLVRTDFWTSCVWGKYCCMKNMMGMFFTIHYSFIVFVQNRAPAFLDNLSQAFLMAPFFVILEVVFCFVCHSTFVGYVS